MHMHRPKGSRIVRAVDDRKVWGLTKTDASTTSRRHYAKANHERDSHDENTVGMTESDMRWEAIDWKRTEKHVRRLQYKIAKAESEGNHNKAKRIQHLLTESFDAKLLAVKYVTSNRGARTPGVDGEVWLTGRQKMDGTKALNNRTYRAKPLRRIHIPKRNGKKRPLSIPCIYDRAMQMLHQLALDPIAEVRLYPHQYGFRIGRSCQDAIERLFVQLSKRVKRSPVYIIEGDIKGMFDNINHEWLMRNIPMNRRILKEFLKAGYIFESRLFPTDLGTPQGSIISPTLANLCIAELGREVERLAGKRGMIHATMYADDVVITAPTMAIAQEIREGIVPILAERGLELSMEKTLITRIEDGFDFLSFNCKKYRNGHVLVTPSKKAVKEFKEKVKEAIRKGQAWTQDDLIMVLNPIIRGWANYHRHNSSSKTFHHIDEYIFHLLVLWGKKRHRNKSWRWIRKRYWHTVGNNNWTFCTDKSRLLTMQSVHIRRHVKVVATKNPYLDREYFLERKSKGRGNMGRCSKSCGNTRTRSPVSNW